MNNSFIYNVAYKIELVPAFNSYSSARTFYEPICVELERKTNAKKEWIDGGYCFIYDQGGKWKYRSVVLRSEKFYVDFAPSIMRGGKRQFDLNGCLENLKEYEGFFVGDIFAPSTDKSKKIVPVYRVCTSDLLQCDLQSHDGFLEFVREN